MNIGCRFKYYEWNFIAPNTVYTCEVISCSISSRGLMVAAFKGKHEELKSNNDVEALYFKNTKLHYLPRNLGEIFPNLTFLEINNCNLKGLCFEDLVGLEKLKVLWLPDNKISAVPVNLFRNMPDLKEVSFQGNAIQRFELKALEPIKDTIGKFVLTSNPGIDEFFERKDGKIKNLIERISLEFKAENAKNLEVMLTQFENFFVTGKHSDFTIKVRGKEYKVHKCILASQSSVFDKLFLDDTGDAGKTISKIKNFKQETFEEFLHYFYTKTTPSEESAVDLLELAIEFDVPALKSECEAVIKQTITSENSCQIFNFAVQHSLKDLKQTAFKTIREFHPEIATFLYDKPEVVNAIIEAKIEFESNPSIQS